MTSPSLLGADTGEHGGLIGLVEHGPHTET